MKLKEALDLVHEALGLLQGMTRSHLYLEASRVLRNGSAKVEKSENMTVRCGYCGKMYPWPLQYCGECMIGVSPGRIKPVRKKWTEHEEIRIVTVRSEPVFTKVE